MASWSKEHLWNYDDQSAWGKVHGWEVANIGKRQSPIDIQTAAVRVNEDLTPIQLEGRDALLSGLFENTGHSLQFTPSISCKTTLFTPHGTYSFKQFHFHWGSSSSLGSEHHVDGYSYATEIHFVHAKNTGSHDADDSLAVLGVLCCAESKFDKNTHWEKIGIPQEPGQTIRAEDIKISSFLPPELDYYYYKGSLTTPPCSEKVLWYVLKQPLKVPEDFLVNLRQMKDSRGQTLTKNFRQCMPLNDRFIETPKQ